MSATPTSVPAPGFASAGVADVAVERPADVESAAQLLRDSGGSLLFRGSGSKAQWGGRPARPDLVVETTGLDRLLVHNPADMTASVQAGMSLRALQEQLARSGQWLAIDPASEAAGATIGGLLATGDSGPRRLRYGAMRDLVIGVTLVLPDGTVAKSGGHVIKNVAGYDLAKLMHGSLGTLALLVEVALRLHPLPETSATLVTPAGVEQATDIAVRLLASPLEPAAVDWLGRLSPGGDGELAIRFEGTAAGVQAQVDAVRGLFEAGLRGGGARVELLRDSDEAAFWARLASTHVGAPEETLASAGSLPTRTPDVSRALAEAAAGAGADASLSSRPALGLHLARFRGDAGAQARAFEAWRSRVLALGGSVLLRERPAAVDDLVDALGPPPSAVHLLRAVKGRLDAEGRCAPGRLGPWY